MKKLLALVLCVMMFVSVLPTAAFAGGYDVDDPLYSVAGYNKQITNMIKNTKKNVEKAYKALVGDQVVYTSAKAMDDTIVDMVNAITDPLIEKGKANKAFADGVKNNIRHYLDEVVADKIADNYYKALDSDGNRDDLKYAQLVADSINKALTDKKFIAGYQAVATYFALGQIVSDINDTLKDEYNAFRDTIDPKFQTRFATEYTHLVDEYIDTIGTATLKVLEGDLAELAYDEAVADAKADYAATVAAAALVRDAAIDEADEAYDKAVDPAAKKLAAAYEKAEADYEATVKGPKATYEGTKAYRQNERDLEEAKATNKRDAALQKAEDDYKGYINGAEAKYESDMEAAAKIVDPQARADAEAQAAHDRQETINNANWLKMLDTDKANKDYKDEMATAKKNYETAVNPTKEAYDKAVKTATKAYDAAIDAADAAYDRVEEKAAADYAAAVKDAKDAYDAIDALALAESLEAIEEAYDEYSPYWDYVINPWAEVVYAGVGSAF